MKISAFISTFLFISLTLGTTSAMAAPLPAPQVNNPLQRALETLKIRLDITNMTGANNTGFINAQDLAQRVTLTNELWSQCSIEWVPAKFETYALIKFMFLMLPEQWGSRENLRSSLFRDA